jgi:flagellar motor switch protein FliN
MDNQANKKAAQGFAELFARSLGDSLTEALGSALRVRLLESPDLSTRQERPVLFRIQAEGGLSGECFLQMYEAQVANLGAKILGQRAVDFSDAHTEALGKAVSSAMAGVAAGLSAEHGEVRFKAERVAEMAFGGMLLVPLTASLTDGPELPANLYFEVPLLTGLAKLEKQPAEASKPAADALNLKLVMDVELNVSLRFGQRQLPLREVLELTSGSVVELDRQVDEPVELLLDGKVIALGEAVIVDGNYGLRVTEVPQPIASHLKY